MIHILESLGCECPHIFNLIVDHSNHYVIHNFIILRSSIIRRCATGYLKVFWRQQTLPELPQMSIVPPYTGTIIFEVVTKGFQITLLLLVKEPGCLLLAHGHLLSKACIYFLMQITRYAPLHLQGALYL